MEIHLKGEVARRSAEAELDADGVEDVAREERQPADQEGGWIDLNFIVGIYLRKARVK